MAFCPLSGRGSRHLQHLQKEEKDPGPLQLPVGDKRLPEPLVSVSPRLVSLLSRPLKASAPSFGQYFLPPICPFPSLDISLSPFFVLSYLCPLLFLCHIFPRESECPAATASILSAYETCSFWATMAHLGWWQTEVGEARLIPCRCWSRVLSLKRDF